MSDYLIGIGMIVISITVIYSAIKRIHNHKKFQLDLINNPDDVRKFQTTSYRKLELRRKRVVSYFKSQISSSTGEKDINLNAPIIKSSGWNNVNDYLEVVDSGYSINRKIYTIEYSDENKEKLVKLVQNKSGFIVE